MPWHIESDHDECGEGQWAVVKDDDGTVEGCHDTEAEAQEQLAALYASEENSMTLTAEWREFLTELEQVRAAHPKIGVEMRTDGDGDMPTMFGHFSVFNRWYEIDSLFEGRFLERVAPGAFKRTIDAHHNSDGGRVRVLFDHGFDDNRVLGPIEELREDNVGAYYEVSLLDTSYNRDLIPGLQAGLYGSSFRFRVVKDEWNDEPEQSDHNPDRLPERTIREMKVFEFGPVTFPANPDATAGIRSMTDDFYDRVTERHPDRYQDVLARARQLRTPEREPATDGTSREGLASPAEDSPEGHSEVMTRAERQHRVRELIVITRGVDR